MTPERKGQLRHIASGLGGAFTALGIAPEILTIDNIDATLQACAVLIGFGLLVYGHVSSWLAKRAASKEARLIAEKVDVAKSEGTI